jgi:hypothetical protein
LSSAVLWVLIRYLLLEGGICVLCTLCCSPV